MAKRVMARKRMGKSPPLRTCLVTGEELPKEQLLRFVASPEGRVVPDIKGNLPGRGMWIQPRKALVKEACKRNLFSKSSRTKLRVDEGLADTVERLLKEQALAYLNRARLARDMVSGHEKVLSLLQNAEAAVLIHAEDAAEDGIKKLDKHAEGIPILRFGSRDELSRALNLPNPVHLALRKGGISEAFLQAFDLWKKFAL